MKTHIELKEDQESFTIEQKKKNHLTNITEPTVQLYKIIMLLIGIIFLVIFLASRHIDKDNSNIQESKPEIVLIDDSNNYIFDYPTVGIPIPGKMYNTTPVKQPELDYYDEQFSELLKPNNDTNCEFIRIGDEVNQKDGGYIICKNFLNATQGLINIGINGTDKFGCELSSMTKATNHQFDCTNYTQPLCETNENKNQFNYECVASNSKISSGKKYISLVDIIRRYNLTGKHIFLKFDIEGAQWNMLKHFPQQHLQYIDQITLEFHIGEFQQQQWGQLDIIRTLMKYFVSVNYHMNNYACTRGTRKIPSIAIQATLVNRKLIKLNSESKSYNLHYLNYINAQNFQDCQMI